VDIFSFSEKNSVDVEADELGRPFQSPSMVISLELFWEIELLGTREVLINVTFFLRSSEDVDVRIQVVAVVVEAWSVSV
jgi:hypothetical protein